MTKDELRQTLEAFPDVEPGNVVVLGDGKLVAKIVVRAFNDVDEAERQQKVYAFLRGKFSEDDMQSIEFIFTNAPSDPSPTP